MGDEMSFIDTVIDVEHHIKICVIILILALNLSVILMYMKLDNQLKRNTTNILLLNQTLADMTISTPLMMHVLPQDMQHKVWPHGYPLLWYTVFVSLGSVLLTTIERYIHLKDPTNPLNVNSNKRLFVAVLSVWLFAVVPAAASAIAANVVVNNLEDYWVVMSKLSVTLCLIVLFIVLLIIILLILSVRLLNSNIQVTQTGGTTRRRWQILSGTDKQDKERRTVKLIFATIVVYTFTTFPWLIVEVVYTLYNHHDYINAWKTLFVLLGATYILYTLSACVKPLLTMFLNDDYHSVLYAGWCRVSGLMKVVPRSDGVISMNDIEDSMVLNP